MIQSLLNGTAPMARVLVFLVLSTMVAAGCTEPGDGGGGGPTGPDNSRTYNLTVNYGSGGAVRGALIRIPLSGGSYTATTNGNGKCTIKIPDSVALPTWVIATIDHPAIMPESTTFPGGSGQDASRLTRVLESPKTVYVRDASVHHLGNDQYGGEPNSQLQLSTEGIERSYTFHLDTYPSRMPKLRVFARGVQELPQIKINGSAVAQLGDSFTSGDLSVYDFRLGGSPTSNLHPGSNVMTIRTGAYNQDDPWDDIEYSGLTLYFE